MNEQTLQYNSGICLTGIMPEGASLQMTSSELYGDQQACIGTTTVTSIGISPDYTGDWPPHPYIGDTIIPPYDPFSPGITPWPVKVYPSVSPYPWGPNPWHPDTTPWDILPFIPPVQPFQPTFQFSLAPVWSLDMQVDKCIAKLDLPGVRVNDLKVEIENGTITVVAKRFDTGLLDSRTNVNSQQFIGTSYDPKTSEATLEAGVLTVIVLKFKTKSAFSVPVTVK